MSPRSATGKPGRDGACEDTAPRPGPAGISRHRSGAIISTDLRGNRDGQCLVALGVDLRHVGVRVAEQDLGGFQSVLLPHARREAVTQLIREPSVCPPPFLKLLTLVVGESPSPFPKVSPSRFASGSGARNIKSHAEAIAARVVGSVAVRRCLPVPPGRRQTCEAAPSPPPAPIAAKRSL